MEAKLAESERFTGQLYAENENFFNWGFGTTCKVVTPERSNQIPSKPVN